MSVPVQRSLFPDHFELHEAALAALRDLVVDRALALVQRARALDARLVDGDELLEALHWLRARMADRSGGPGELLLAVAADAIAGRIRPVAAAFVDTAVARFVAARAAAGPFLDPAHRVPRAVTSLIAGDATGARTQLLDLLAGGAGVRAELWAYLGDANWRLERADDAVACYVRALLLDAARVDLWRTAHGALRATFLRLCAEQGEPAARDLLFAHAWLEGLLHIPAGNRWLEPRQLPPASAAEPARRFAQLLYLDRSATRGDTDLERREEMAALLPALFERYMRVCSTREDHGRRA